LSGNLPHAGMPKETGISDSMRSDALLQRNSIQINAQHKGSKEYCEPNCSS
jgi:hypothetical protein